MVRSGAGGILIRIAVGSPVAAVPASARCGRAVSDNTIWSRPAVSRPARVQEEIQ